MCSIPGQRTPGSEVTVHILRVHLSPLTAIVELWAETNREHRHAYERMKREIQIPKMGFCESEGAPGDLCLARLNGTWRRAKITSRRGRDFNVFFIDEGTSHIATSKTLAWGPNNSFLLPPEVELCVLANVAPLSHENKWSPRAADYLKSLRGKTLSGCVQNVLMPDQTVLLNIPDVCRHMYEVGFARNISPDKFKGLVLSFAHLEKGDETSLSDSTPSKSIKRGQTGCELDNSRQYLYPELLTETLENVEVTEVINPNKIFCKLSIFSKELKKLSEQMEEYYEGRVVAFSKVRLLVSGFPCVARGSNGKWYRSILQQDLTSTGLVEVKYVDFGKTEFVSEDDVRPLNEKFLRMPVVTYLCSLHGIKEKDTGWTSDEVEYLKMLLLDQTIIAKFESYNSEDDIYLVTLYLDGPVSINSCFEENANKSCKSEPCEDFISQSETELPGSEVLMDFRNPFNLTVESLSGNISSLLSSKSLPRNASQEVSNCVSRPANSTAQVAKDCSCLDSQASSYLSPCSPSDRDNLLKEHLFHIGRVVDVKVSCIESPSKFWCQMSESSDSLILLMQDMQYYYDSCQPQKPVESLCVARHPENGMWYRAGIVTNHQSTLVDVRFIDYGQTKKVPLQDLRWIDPKFLELEAQAFQCCLPHQTQTWGAAALAEFHRFVDSATFSNVGLKCTVIAVTCDSQGAALNVVDVETPFQSASKLLAEKEICAPAPLKDTAGTPVILHTYNYLAPNVEVGAVEEVLITFSGTVSHFYGQLVRNSHLLEGLKEYSKWLCQQPQHLTCPLVLNMSCLAKYTDYQWRRGEIKSTHPNLLVHFVDYGDTLTVDESDVRPFPVQAGCVGSLPVQAIPFGLFNVPADASPEVNRWFKHQIIGRYLTFSVVAKDSRGNLMVELYDGTRNINAKVRDMLEEERRRGDQSLVEVQDITNHSSQSSIPPTLGSAEGTTWKGHGPTLGEEPSLQTCLERTKQKNTSHHNAVETLFKRDQKMFGLPAFQRPLSQSKPASCPADQGKPASTISRITDLAPRVLKQGLVTEVFVSYWHSPSDFFVQLKHDEDDINVLVAKMNDARSRYAEPADFQELQLGDLVMVEYSEDNSWYRAVVRDKPEDGTVHVEFIDFGNLATVSSLRVCRLDKQFGDLPRFSTPCTLGGVGEEVGWNPKAVSKFKRMTMETAEKTYACTFIKKTGSVWEVSLVVQGVVLSEAFVQGCRSLDLDQDATLSCPEQSRKPLQYKKPNVSVGQREEVYASSIVAPNYFWCQYSNSDELNRISKLAQEVGSSPQEAGISIDSLGAGSPCLALFAEDGQWYRAQVIRRACDVFTVLFVDYGNESDVQVEALRWLPTGLMEMSPQAFLCSLEGFVEPGRSWDDKAVEEFYKLLVDKPLTVTVVEVERHAECFIPQYKVTLECDESSVNDKMEKHWKALTAKDAETTSCNTQSDGWKKKWD